MAKVWRSIWGGVVQYEDDDTPPDVQSFNVFGKSAPLWVGQSRGLHQAAVAMVQHYVGEYPNTKDPYRETIALMLGGYAIEALLKMVTIADHCAQHGFTFDSKHAKQFLPATHDLKKLVSLAKLRTTKADRELLDQLSKYTVWGGRYPIPLDPAGYNLPMIFEGVPKPRPAPGKSKIWKAYTVLYAKLNKLAVRKVFGKAAEPHKRTKRR